MVAKQRLETGKTIPPQRKADFPTTRFQSWVAIYDPPQFAKFGVQLALHNARPIEFRAF